MTLADVSRLFRHWQAFPPLRVLVAGFVGFEPKAPEAEGEKKYMTAEDMKRLMAMTDGRIPGMS